MTPDVAARPRARAARGRWVIVAIAAIAFAPVVLSYAFYYLFPRDVRTNYGTLLPTQPFAAVAGTLPDGKPFHLADLRGKWVLVMFAPGRCPAPCERTLYATRQARTIQNAEESRVVRLWLVTDDTTPAPALLAQHPGLVIASVSDIRPLPLPDADAIYLVDPLGNQVLAWPVDPDIKALSRDLARLLKASRIG